MVVAFNTPILDNMENLAKPQVFICTYLIDSINHIISAKLPIFISF